MMKWMECRATRQEIDEGGEQLGAQALRHVASCAPCLAFQNERARLRELLTSLEPVTAPADFDFRLRARIAAQTDSVGSRSVFAGITLSTPAIALAAAVVVVALSAVWFVRLNQNRTPMVVSNPESQGRQGNSPKIDNAAPPINQTSAPDVTTATVGPNPGPDAPIYLVRGGKPQFRDPGSSQPGRSSRDLSAGSAPSIKQGQNPGAVYVSAPVKPMVFSLEDDKGATRKISLPPVSFGSQRLLVGSRVVPVNSTNDRVW
jgi:hypothetical protein